MPKKEHPKHKCESQSAENAQPLEQSPQAEEPALDPMQTLIEERDQLKASYLRLAADMDNYRKRTEKEKEDYRKYAVKNLIEKLLPVLDNFGRCLHAEGDAESLKQGAGMILTQLEGVMGEAGLQKIELSSGDEFDPQLAEALMMEENPEAPYSLTIAEVFENGWRIGEQTLRTAKVKVYKK